MAARERRREPDYDAEMKLPAGKTCGDCFHIRRCLGLGYTSAEANTSCDFWPSRFREPRAQN